MSKHIRVIIFWDKVAYCAQCLECDVCIQSGTVSDIIARLELALKHEANTGAGPLYAAPEKFHKMWDSAGSKAETVITYEGLYMVREILR